MTTATALHAWLRRLSDYHSGAGSPAERAAVEAHLATCAECQEALAMYRRFYTLAASPLRLGAPRLTTEDGPTLPLAAGGGASRATLPSPPATLPASRPPRRRPRPLIGTLAAVLAVALLTASFVALLLPRLHHPVSPVPTPSLTQQPFETPTMTPPQPSVTLPPTATFIPAPTIYNGPIPPDPRTVCPASGGAPLSVTQMAPATFGFGSDAGGQRLPDDLAQKPQQITSAIADAPAINPSSTSAFIPVFSAPPAGQTSIICGVTVTIVAYQPIPTPVPNFTIPCRDDYYAVPGGFQGTGDCGATPAPHGEGSVSFSSATVGATATSSIIDVYLGAPPQPAQEPRPAAEQNTPDTYLVLVHVSQPGAYTFGFSFWQSSAGPSITSPTAGDTLAADQVLHEWGGPQCLTPAMQSQLPPPPPSGQPPLRVLCPGPPQLPPGS